MLFGAYTLHQVNLAEKSFCVQHRLGQPTPALASVDAWGAPERGA